jgi:hypothetical protein
MKRIILLVWLALGLLPTVGLSHSGRTDANGGHYNRKTGEYHYHNGGRAAPPRSTVSESLQDPQSQTVYITRTGHKYHRDGCRYLKSRIPISLQEAKRQYSPCKVCMPPA